MHSTLESDCPLWNRLTWFIWRKKLYSTTGSSSSLPKLLNKAINWKIIFSWNFFGVKISKVFAPRLLPAPHRRWLRGDWLSSHMQSSYSSSSSLHHPHFPLIIIIIVIVLLITSSSPFSKPHKHLVLLIPKMLWLNNSAIPSGNKICLDSFLGEEKDRQLHIVSWVENNFWGPLRMRIWKTVGPGVAVVAKVIKITPILVTNPVACHDVLVELWLFKPNTSGKKYRVLAPFVP